ncbi:type I glutamate--ammonia ligase [Sinorhizobium meliloti]|uniref:type I glutamate--ammonia ligase n=1 Tax=Rhizobium meliloti TaxID=382 RepID=UPI000FD71766|nr:type I glutamate--ammonia ligase [Sinorhizobium meliloti]RVH60570.1 type I glutamate--ammonia ligase [Sinorhizobium meliloti]RVK57715.1 type I glutamate--ammonia ligase [Sinorhizobium meliloti]
MQTAKAVLKFIQDDGVQYVAFRFTVPRGKWHHITLDASMVDQDTFANGIMFDGSSIAGWKTVNESDMTLVPDPTTAQMIPFPSAPTLMINCDILEPKTGEPYNRDPRGIAKRAEAYLKSTGIADTVYVGAEPEFLVFDSAEFTFDPYNSSFKLTSSELPINAGTHREGGNHGHRIQTKAGYLPVPPLDSGQDMRGMMLAATKAMGVTVEKHHHEVAPARHKLSIKYDTLLRSADSIQILKYCLLNVAQSRGKTANVMAEPVFGENGSGMHVHQSLWKDGKPLFAGNEHASLSREALWYIGGIIKHARALNAFTNPTTNSYKRLVPGHEAPVLLAYSGGNRSASCRIPFATSPEATRVEVRFPDSAANPYLAFAAVLMAGLDGILNKIDPGAPMDQDLYELPQGEQQKIQTVCGSLREALVSLEKDRAFLKAGGVFDDDFIDSYIKLKMEEVTLQDTASHEV